MCSFSAVWGRTSLRWLFLVALCGLCWGCDGSDGFEPPTGAVAAPPVLRRKLSGNWGGYFPGSSLQHPETGIEVHLDEPVAVNGNLRRAGFINRDHMRASMHDLKVDQQGDQVVLRFDPDSLDEGVFRGTFVDDFTVRGTYSNATRGESIELDLRDAASLDLTTIKPLAQASVTPVERSAPALLAQNAALFLTLRIELDAPIGSARNHHVMSWGYGPYSSADGQYGKWQDHDAAVPYNNGDDDQINHGTSTVSTMVFYPDWLVLDFYAEWWQTSLEDAKAGTFYLPWTDLIKLDPSHLGSGSWVAQADMTYVNYQYVEPQNMKLSYFGTPTQYDIGPWCVSDENPQSRNVIPGGNVYQVPGNTIKLLQSLNFVLPFQP